MTKINPIIINGKKILLTHVTRRNLGRIIKWSQNTELRQLSGESKELSYFDAVTFLGSMSPDSRRFWYLIIDLASGKPIGDCALIGSLQPMKYTDLLLRIWERKYWGRGHSTEVMRLLLDLAFDKLDLSRVRVEIIGFNLRAITFYKRFGFKRYSKKSRKYTIDGKPYDFVRMSLSRRIYYDKITRRRNWRNRLGYQPKPYASRLGGLPTAQFRPHP